MQVGKSLGKQKLKITSTRVTSKGSETIVETDICGCDGCSISQSATP